MSKFKVGDWVISTRGNIEQITCIAPRGYGNYYGEAEDIIINYRDSNDYDFIDSSVKLWKPKAGEWCVFKNGQENSATIAQYGSSKLTWDGYYNGDYEGACEPFIGTLPSLIKDK